MKNRLIWVLAAALFLASLYALTFPAGKAGYANLLLAAPSSPGTPGQSPEKLEEFSKEEFLLTYEIRQPATAQAVNSGHTVTLVGTNHNYANIMGYLSLDGGFFTQAAMDEKSRHATLNETAAFQIFGGIRISGSILKLNGETWLVTGVIQDNDDENPNIYVPSGVTGGRADSVMVLMDESVTEAYVKNALKGIGIHESGYDFINLSRSAEAFKERFSVAWKSALSAAILFFILVTGGWLLEKLRFYRGGMRDMYFRELLSLYRSDFLKTVSGLLMFAAGVAAVLFLSLQILETCLNWQRLAPITGELTAGDFGRKLLWLRDYQPLGCALFGICICLIFLCLILFARPHGRAGHDGLFAHERRFRLSGIRSHV